jgi:hypothetical protein
MQMIDVLNRLAELDAANPNIVTRHVKESGNDPQMAGLQQMLSTAKEPWEKAQLQWRIKNLQGQQSVAGEPGGGLGGPRDATGNLIPTLPSKEWMAKNPTVVKQLPREALPPEMQGTDTMGRLRDLFREEPEETPDQPTTSDNTDKPNWLVTPDEANASQDEEERLAAMNENEDLAECGPMGMPSEVEHHTPASINMTADSGPELSGMLADIMKLAGVHKVEPEHLGIEHDPVVITAIPGAAVGATAADHSDTEHDHDDSIEVDDESSNMRRMMDMMNPDIDEEVDESGYTNTPNDPNIIPEFDPEIYANHENQPGQGDRMDGNMPRAFATMEEQLMADWKQFVTEGVAEDATPTPGLQSDGKYYNKAGRLVGKWNGRILILDPEFEKYHRNEGGFGDEEIEQMRGTFQHRIQKLTAPSEDSIKYLANELEKSDIQAGRPRQSRNEYHELAVRMLSDRQGVAEGDSGAKYRVKTVGNDVNPATGERCDYYINPVTGEKVYCKPGQKVNKGDHVTPSGTVKPKG